MNYQYDINIVYKALICRVHSLRAINRGDDVYQQVAMHFSQFF